MGQRLGSVVVDCEPGGGGDINEAYRLVLADGRSVFAKLNRRAPPGFFESEALGIGWLGEARALALPSVLGVGAAAAPGAHGASPGAFLLLEWIEPGPRARRFDEKLGAGLAALHRSGPPTFGLEHDNFIALLPQHNRGASDWAEFYRERRLRPSFERARSLGLLDAALERMAEKLLARLEQLVGPEEPPARLHGDLWGGNLHVSERGEPVLIDPAAYAGHREIDLAMMRLFGGFGARVFDAYAESFPLSPGHEERVALYQLYPLLVHLCSFGAGYLGQVTRCLSLYI
jgi:fructosamine-3-kinase